MHLFLQKGIFHLQNLRPECPSLFANQEIGSPNEGTLSSPFGNDAILGIIYLEVAKRFGIECEPIHSLGTFMLGWKENPKYKHKTLYFF